MIKERTPKPAIDQPRTMGWGLMYRSYKLSPFSPDPHTLSFLLRKCLPVLGCSLHPHPVKNSYLKRKSGHLYITNSGGRHQYTPHWKSSKETQIFLFIIKKVVLSCTPYTAYAAHAYTYIYHTRLRKFTLYSDFYPQLAHHPSFQTTCISDELKSTPGGPIGIR